MDAPTSGTTVLIGATGTDVINGLGYLDVIDLGALTADLFLTTVGTTISDTAANAGTISIVRGGYVSSTGIFTTSSTGADSLVVYDTTGSGAGTTVATIVLVGYALTGSTSTIDGVITLGCTSS